MTWESNVSVIRDYFWPNPTKQISAESQAAMRGDLQDKTTLILKVQNK